MTQERISELKEKSVEIIQSEEQREEKMGVKMKMKSQESVGQ